MRNRKEIENELEPLQGGSITFDITSIANNIIIELLLDIRDLLTPKE